MAKLLALALLGLLALAPALAADVTATHIEKQKIMSNENFPDGPRPPLPTFRTLDSAVSASCQRSGTTIKLNVVHKELPNVNGTMMQWFWQNVATRSATVGNATYPMFQLFHPRDHVYAKGRITPLAADGGNPSTVNFQEFPLLGCTTADNAAGKTWTCPTAPAANPGVLKSTNLSEWQFLDQVNAVVNIASLSKTGVRFRTQGCKNNDPATGPCAWIIRTGHTWTTRKWTDAATKVKYFALKQTSTVTVGIGMAQYDGDIVTGWANGLDPVAKCWRLATHFVEETGTLADWLPQAYANRA